MNHRIASGFTLVELIIVIVVIGILAVSVAPRFVGNNAGVEIATIEARLMGLLRLQQQRAMQDTATCCYGIIRTSTKVAMKAISGVSLPAESERDIALGATVLTIHSALPGASSEFYFNSKGCPVSSNGGACGEYTIEIALSAGTESRRVCVQSQGYINAEACP
ncbi:MAG TPA: prepilin-type N-terminal cleavage/methylation domain-containing protein [Aliidiomarina sp.]|nr:prepilin-type N-terminal cleavage/methylation domain-containing protein [Aliidiomarina sp.]